MSIKRINKGDNLSQSENIVESNIEKLKALFPEIVAEGKIDFKVLQEVLGEEVEQGEEYYRFTWAGKANARREAQKPSTGTLRPAPEESVDWNTTQNLYIEGDNLEVLKLLQKSYASKIKMIYIDPPYNTGKDFVYKDNYKDNLRNYQEVTGQLDEDGNKLSTNSDSDGRYHSNWLNMMYPRLRLARNLLKDDGVVFMSIGEDEIQNFRKISDEIFGEDNFIAQLIWQKKFSRANDATYFSTMHDYILCYAKKNKLIDSNGFDLQLLSRSLTEAKGYSNPDNDFRGEWTSVVLSARSGTDSLNYEIITPSGRSCFPPDGRFWSVNKEKFQELVRDNRIWFGKNGDGTPRLKTFFNEVQSGLRPNTIWFHEEVGHNQEGRQELKKLFDDKAYFDSPKPVRLLLQILYIANSKDSIIMDFFSGSATTAHAVMQLNAEDGGNRKHIQVQLPEPTEEKSEAYKAGYKTIADIGKERIRRAASKIKEEHPDKAKDLGFKVFKLDTSNIKAWDGNPENLENTLFDAQENIKTDRTEHDVLYEILLKYGLDLTLPIEEKQIESKTVFSVGYGALFICLSDNLNSTIAEGIGKWKEELQPEVCRVVFKDAGFTDVEKTNSVQILKRFGITEIKSI
ncbi:site-specific DNA-methyltransferase [Tenacibaculum discolor]|uniref:site-specific DNA-methyltransferase n=1 Tax=Tenacibaculum discolor TaxID=361581 RepID=UPI000F5A8819|nr:site-specific DNA-methyltransferase [Tenacibaculum discolor]